MANFHKIARVSTLFGNLSLNTSKHVSSNAIRNSSSSSVPSDPTSAAKGVSSETKPQTVEASSIKSRLMEFFDLEKNWGAQEVKTGRSWNKEELRLKSNTDLHKIWYVLLKERNMLLTMEQESKDQTRLFPSPERLDKVEDSMKNLEVVVRERNKAYHQLETGETGERPGKMETSVFGLRYYRRMCEYPVPKHMNKKWFEKYQFYQEGKDKDVEAFLLKYREKLYLEKRKKRNRDFNHVIQLMNRFPNMDMGALKEQYPEVDIERAKMSRKYKGAF